MFIFLLLRYIRPPIQSRENKGSISIGGGYSESEGWHGDIGVSISFAKQQERQKLISRLIELEQEETKENAKQLSNKGSVHVDGGYSEGDGWHVDGGFEYSWARQQERRQIIKQLALLESDKYEIQPNKGSVHVDGGYSEGDGWHVDGGFEYSWAKKQQSNFAIPSWVISTLKFLLEEFISDIASKYRIEVSWEPNFENQYKACIISLINIEKSNFNEEVKASLNKVIKNKFPIHIKFEKYNGNPSAIIYW